MRSIALISQFTGYLNNVSSKFIALTNCRMLLQSNFRMLLQNNNNNSSASICYSGFFNVTVLIMFMSGYSESIMLCQKSGSQPCAINPRRTPIIRSLFDSYYFRFKLKKSRMAAWLLDSVGLSYPSFFLSQTNLAHISTLTEDTCEVLHGSRIFHPGTKHYFSYFKTCSWSIWILQRSPWKSM